LKHIVRFNHFSIAFWLHPDIFEVFLEATID